MIRYLDANKFDLSQEEMVLLAEYMSLISGGIEYRPDFDTPSNEDLRKGGVLALFTIVILLFVVGVCSIDQEYDSYQQQRMKAHLERDMTSFYWLPEDTTYYFYTNDQCRDFINKKMKEYDNQ